MAWKAYLTVIPSKAKDYTAYAATAYAVADAFAREQQRQNEPKKADGDGDVIVKNYCDPNDILFHQDADSTPVNRIAIAAEVNAGRAVAKVAVGFYRGTIKTSPFEHERYAWVCKHWRKDNLIVHNITETPVWEDPK
jgi:hypothetical protein